MTDKTNKLPYDSSTPESIVYYSLNLEGKTLREACGVQSVSEHASNKGALGSAVEQYFFKYSPNSNPGPDFAQAGIEVKTTPLKLNKKGQKVAKERLVLSMINYMEVVNETWETSAVLRKSKHILLLFYMYEPGVNPVDYRFELAKLWEIPPEDLPTIKQDWQCVVDKVRAGRAHEISGADTLYLEACTKAANSAVRRPQPFSAEPAKPRAWALKQSYMTAIAQKLLDAQAISRSEAQVTLSLKELVRARFSAYFGKTEEELAQLFGLAGTGARKPKNLCALITKRILGVDPDQKILEFEKAGVKTKTIRVKTNGVPKESISFPAFDYFDLAKTPFEQSAFLEQLEQKYLFVIYAESAACPGKFCLQDVLFWQMPEADLPEARACYEEMQLRVRAGRANESVRASENRCCHVRPHGRNAQDTLPTPAGPPEVKKCFWLNAQYIATELARLNT
jgi:DNA mismatch repair endonuclease MutH